MLLRLCCFFAHLARVATALSLDVTNVDSIKSAASTVAHGMMNYYNGNQTGQAPGTLPSPYFWWEAGALFGHLVDYYYYTGDDTYNDVTNQAMTWQGGISGTFMPSNQTDTEGNDDQAYWAFTVMSAAELNFPPPHGDYPSWTAMAQAVFNTQAARWDPLTCNGGLRWQMYEWNNGWTYKNIPANGGFFLLAARLARYTGNDTYVDWAEKMWDWIEASVLWEDTTPIRINDGTSIVQKCTSADHDQWSYNYSILLVGFAYLYNHTNSSKWMTPLNEILNATLIEFFPNGKKEMSEIQCEPYVKCSTDALTFKSFGMRWLAVTAQLVPSLAPTIWPYIQASALGAAGQCDGGSDGVTCGYMWNTTKWDGTWGVGQQMSALAAIQANMILAADLQPPLTLVTGGTSKSDPGSGSTSNGPAAIFLEEISTSDKAGAGVLTAVAVLLTLGVAYFIIS